MNILVVRHIEDNSLGPLETILAERGIGFEYAWGRALDDGYLALRGESGPIAGLVILGGKESAADDDRLAYLRREQELIRAAIVAGLPVFGICLGAQMLARSLGAPVEKLRRRHATAPENGEAPVGDPDAGRSPNDAGAGKTAGTSPDDGNDPDAAVKEIGWTPIALSAAGLADPVLSQIQGASQFQWHEDTYHLPPGAVHLAASNLCPQQAFRLEGAGKVYGVQFHPEVSREVIAQWLSESRTLPPARRQIIARETDACFDSYHAASRRMFAAWCEQAGF